MMTERERILARIEDAIEPFLEDLADAFYYSDYEPEDREISRYQKAVAEAALRVIEAPKSTEMDEEIRVDDEYCPTCQHHCPYRVVGTKCIHCGD